MNGKGSYPNKSTPSSPAIHAWDSSQVMTFIVQLDTSIVKEMNLTQIIMTFYKHCMN